MELDRLSNSSAGDGSFGSASVAAYAKWRKPLGRTGADGTPGRISLSRLGERTGLFSVVA